MVQRSEHERTGDMDDGRPLGLEETDRRGAHRQTGLREQVRRELGVMFSRRYQPIPVRVAKWAVFLAVERGLHGTRWFEMWTFGLPIAGLSAHLFYRRMTRGWTESWGGWDDVGDAQRRTVRAPHARLEQPHPPLTHG